MLFYLYQGYVIASVSPPEALLRKLRINFHDVCQGVGLRNQDINSRLDFGVIWIWNWIQSAFTFYDTANVPSMHLDT